MRFLGIAGAGFAAVLIGLGLGAIPTLNEYLHWNIWFIVPVSGLIFGGAVGWLQFRGAYLAGAPVGLLGIDQETGRIWIDQAAELAPGDHEFALTVQVTDSAGYSDATTIALRVIALAGEPSSLVVAATTACACSR